MKRYVSSIVAVLVMVACAAVLSAGHNTISGISISALFTSEVVNPSASVTSAAADVQLGQSESQSVQITVAGDGGAPNLAVVYMGSLDGTSYGEATSNTTVCTITADGTYMAAVAAPLSSRMKIKLVNQSASVTATASVKVGAQ